jgi:NhaA family Na+:H+ antiporter
MKQIINLVSATIDSGRLTGILLILCTVVSLLLSNSWWAPGYLHFWHLNIPLSFLNESIEWWINDGLMAIFFFMVGLEIRRELIAGQLSSLRKSLLPVLAAAGGMVVPALIYILFNIHTSYLHGWAVPMATDIAFSLGILSLLGSRVPVGLKIFLTALAIIDDLGAVLVIAFFYTSELHLEMLLYALAILGGLLLMNRLKIKPLVFYLIPGIFLWWFILNSGVHATIAGVLLSLCIPMNKVAHTEHSLAKPVNFLIIPLFALANTAIHLPGNGISELAESFSLGIILGLLIGKPVGITLASYLSIRSGFTQLPEGSSWRQLYGVGFTAGIGFTMSIFIANLAFEQKEILDASKIAILTASLFSALVGVFILLMKKKRENNFRLPSDP